MKERLILQDAKEEGREEGWKERDQEAKATDWRRVLKMHERGMSIPEIADCMDLSAETISGWIAGPRPAAT